MAEPKTQKLNDDSPQIKPARNRVQQFLLNVAGGWEQNKPQLLKDVPMLDYGVGPTLDYLAGKGGEENALSIMPTVAANKLYKSFLDNTFEKNKILYHNTVVPFDNYAPTGTGGGFSQDGGTGIYLADVKNSKTWAKYKEKHGPSIIENAYQKYIIDNIQKINKHSDRPYGYEMHQTPFFNNLTKSKDPKIQQLIQDLHQKALEEGKKSGKKNFLSREYMFDDFNPNEYFNVKEDVNKGLMKHFNIPDFVAPKVFDKAIKVPFAVNMEKPKYVKDLYMEWGNTQMKPRIKPTVVIEETSGRVPFDDYYVPGVKAEIRYEPKSIYQAVVNDPKNALQLNSTKGLNQYKNFVTRKPIITAEESSEVDELFRVVPNFYKTIKGYNKGGKINWLKQYKYGRL